MDGFITPSLPPFLFKALLNSRAPWLHERYLASSLLRTHPPPSHLRFISRLSVIEPTLLQRISSWDEQGFSSCLVCPKVACHHYHPAEVFIRFGPFSYEHVVFALRLRARPSRLITFEATYVFVCTTTYYFALTLKVSLSVGFNVLISRHVATQATGFGLLTWQVCLLLNIPAFAGRTTVRETLASYGSSNLACHP